MSASIAKSPLELAIEVATSQEALAEKMTQKGRKTSQQNISWWLRKSGGMVPADAVLSIEAATGGKVTRYDLRPDIFGPNQAAA